MAWKRGRMENKAAIHFPSLLVAPFWPLQGDLAPRKPCSTWEREEEWKVLPSIPPHFPRHCMASLEQDHPEEVEWCGHGDRGGMKHSISRHILVPQRGQAAVVGREGEWNITLHSIPPSPCGQCSCYRPKQPHWDSQCPTRLGNPGYATAPFSWGY